MTPPEPRPAAPVAPPVLLPIVPPRAEEPACPKPPPSGAIPELSLQPSAVTTSAKQAETVKQEIRVIRVPPMK
jgi:hypothetical protein